MFYLPCLGVVRVSVTVVDAMGERRGRGGWLHACLHAVSTHSGSKLPLFLVWAMLLILRGGNVPGNVPVFMRYMHAAAATAASKQSACPYFVPRVLLEARGVVGGCTYLLWYCVWGVVWLAAVGWLVESLSDWLDGCLLDRLLDTTGTGRHGSAGSLGLG